MSRPSWDSWALAIAEVVATRADCTRAQVGAVLLSESHRVLAVGYNGLLAGVPGCASAGNCPRGRHGRIPLPNLVGLHNCLCGKGWPCPDAVPANSDYANCPATHAERNAIEHTAPSALRGATLYTTRRPCPACWTLIRACGIARVVWPDGDTLA